MLISSCPYISPHWGSNVIYLSGDGDVIFNPQVSLDTREYVPANMYVMLNLLYICLVCVKRFIALLNKCKYSYIFTIIKWLVSLHRATLS